MTDKNVRVQIVEPVGSLWGCCAFCKPVGAVRNPRSARADLLPVVVPEYKKGDFFKGGGIVFCNIDVTKYHPPPLAREPSADCREVVRCTSVGKNHYFFGMECPPSV